MKKLLLSLSLAVGSIFGAFAETFTWDFTPNTTGDSNNIPTSAVPSKTTGTFEGETIVFGQNSWWQKNAANSYIATKKAAPAGYIEFGPFEGKRITSINLYLPTGVTAKSAFALYAGDDTEKTGSFTWSTAGTWSTAVQIPTDKQTGKFKIETTNTGNQCAIGKIEFTYETVSSSVEDPTISYELNGATAEVSISCATEGATIYYGTSKDEISNEYTGTFDVTENCTIYAFAQNGEDKSKTTSRDIVVPYTSFRDVVTKAQDGEELSIVGDFSVIYRATVGAYTSVILTDGISNLLIFNPSDAPEVGTKISKVEGSATIYRGLMEIAEGATLTEGGEGATIAAKEVKTLSGITDKNNVFDQIILDGCTVSGTSSAQKVNFGTESVNLYNRYQLAGITNGKPYKMHAFVWVFNNELALVPYELEDGTVREAVKAPVITPNKRELVEGDLITITCATPDAKIYYTIDDTDPTQESTLYTAPFAISGDVTVKARAYYEGDGDEMLPSEIVSKQYHMPDPYCNVITNSHESEDEGNFNSYTAHVDRIDGVDYAMYGMHNQDKGMQMNYQTAAGTDKKERFCYIIQTTDNEGLSIESIVVDFSDNNKNIEFTVRGSNTPFIAEDKANITTSGDKIGVINNTVTTLEFKKDYNYFAFYPTPAKTNEGAVYMNSVTINYRKPADADESEIPSFDNFEIISGEEGLLTSELPTHDNWITKYQINDGEEMEYTAGMDGIYLETVDDATLHTIKIWHEHYYHGTQTTPHEFNHMTKPSFTVDTENETMSFGKLGEGVKVYFTINGTDPVIKTVTPANAPRRAKASETENTYVLDSAEDATATHVISKSNTTISVQNTVAQAVNINAVAVHEATGTVSDAITKSGVTTSIVAIEAEGTVKAAYDLMGRKVEKPANGLYIIGGQKVRL